jgi:hypothetical protein
VRKASLLRAMAFALFIVAGLAQELPAQSLSPSCPPAPAAVSPAVGFSSPEPAYRSYPKIGVGLSVSPLGISIEAAEPLAPNMNIRAGYNTFGHSDAIQINGINYFAKLNFHSVETLIDWYPRPRFHLSPGVLLYNGNQLTAQASVPSGQIFSISGASYMSMPFDPVTGAAKLDFFKVSPMILAGFGNIAPRDGKHFSFRFEFGGVYQGTPRVLLNLAGGVCNANGTGCGNVSQNSSIQSGLQTARQTISHDASRYGLFPIITIGFGFVL